MLRSPHSGRLEASRISWFPRRSPGLLHIFDRDIGLERPLAPVLVGDFGRQLDLLRAAVEPLDHSSVFLGDETAPDLAGAGNLVVVRIELLVEQQEAADARRNRQ